MSYLPNRYMVTKQQTKKHRFSKSLLTIAIAGMFSNFSMAQETNSSDAAADENEVIVVTGIRGSLRSSLNSKRFAENIKDVISAEDIGNFPDESLADALSRVTGVSIARNGGEASSVSIRGTSPDQVRVEVNGTTAVGAGTNRAFDFDSLSADLIGSLEVIKSQSASDVEGGIGGIVRINTRQPLSYADDITASISLENQYVDLGENNSPKISGLYSQKFLDGTLGFTIGASLEDRTQRIDSTLLQNWRRTAVADDVDILSPIRLAMVARSTEQVRRDANIAIQYRPTDNLDVNFDATIYEFDTTTISQGFNVGLSTCNAASFCSTDENGTPISYDDLSHGVSLPIDLANARLDQGYTMGLDVDYTINEDWSVGLAIDKSSAKRNSNPDLQIVTRVFPYTSPSGQLVIDSGSGVPSLVFDPNSDVDILDATNLAVRQRNINQIITETDTFSIALDFDYELDAGIFSTAEFGVRSASLSNGPTSNLSSVDQSSFRVTSDLGQTTTFDGGFAANSGSTFPGAFATLNPSALAALTEDELDALALTVDEIIAFGGAAVFQNNAGNPLTSGELRAALTQNEVNLYEVEENTNAVYAKLNIDTEFLDMPLTGNFGVRVIETEVDTVSSSNINLDGTGNQLVTLQTNNSYTDTLPSATLNWAFAEDKILRLAAAKVLTRPTLVELAPRATFSLFNDPITGNAGNPELDPFRATTYNISYEWYFSEDGLFAAALFYNDIESEIVRISQQAIFEGEIETDQIQVGDEYLLTTPTNVGGDKVKGLELTFQTPFTFLPEAFHNFGTSLNYTYVPEQLKSRNTTFVDQDYCDQVDGETVCADNAYVQLPILRTSEHTVNATFYYDDGTFDARISYNWRDDYLQSANELGSPRFEEAYGQVDASASYTYSENLSFSLSVVNLTNSTSNEYYAVDATVPNPNAKRPVEYEEYGRRFVFGASYRL